MADGIILGEQVYKKMTAAWLEAAHVVFELDGDREALQEFRYAFGRNPKHIKKAVQRFPELWCEDSPDLFELLATIQLSKIKNDEMAQEIYSDWVGNTDAGLDALKELISEHVDKRERGATLAERIANLVGDWNSRCDFSSGNAKKENHIDENTRFLANQLASIPEVALVIAKRAKAAK